MKELKRTWLIQRLDKPYNNAIANAFSFGGGLVNGGLSKDAFGLLNEIFSFDYMGSAEFEFGAIPLSFRYIGEKQKEYDSWRLIINNIPVYVIGDRDFKKEITDRIKQLSKKDYTLKESTNFPRALGIEKARYEVRTIGWLELDNNFLFFIDEDAFNKTCLLFGIENKTPAK